MTLPLRAKLILIMSVVVAGGTVGTALVTQDYVRRVYQRNLEEDFRAEVRYFTERQFQRPGTTSGGNAANSRPMQRWPRPSKNLTPQKSAPR